jgi:hypothetical protein
VHIESISYEVDGIGMTGHLAYDDNRKGTRPGVLLAHEGPGLDPHVKGRAERLATLGYCAFALDYLGAGEPVRDVQRTMERLAPLMADPAVPRQRGLAGLDLLLDQRISDGDRIACIGYCFGGTVATELSTRWAYRALRTTRELTHGHGHRCSDSSPRPSTGDRCSMDLTKRSSTIASSAAWPTRRRPICWGYSPPVASTAAS